MRAIIIGAGRGSRLMPTTADAPKCFAQVGGRRILDWGLEAFHAAGIDRVVFIGGYARSMAENVLRLKLTGG
jgi:choline kinase